MISQLSNSSTSQEKSVLTFASTAIPLPYCLFPIPHSLFIPYSPLFPIPHSLLFPIPYSPFPIPHSLFPNSPKNEKKINRNSPTIRSHKRRIWARKIDSARPSLYATFMVVEKTSCYLSCGFICFPGRRSF